MMSTSHEADPDLTNRLPDTFQNGFVQAMLFAQGIVNPTARDFADAISALQEYRLISDKFEGRVPGYHTVSRRRQTNRHA